MVWESITMSSLPHIKKGSRVSPSNPVDKTGEVFFIVHVSPPETGEFLIQRDIHDAASPIKKTTEQFLKENWWVELWLF